VITVHDLGLRTVPWTLRSETLRELTDKLEHSIFEARRIITVSEAIKTELGEYGYAEAERVRAVHHGPGHLSEIEPGDLPGGVPPSFALHVGTLEPRKNVEMLLAAWRLLRRRRPDAPALVFCGRFGWKAGEIRTALELAAAEGWAHHLGYVSEEELAALYHEAQLVVFPSLYEGFGLPAVEAFWAGTPLVCSDIAALREVAGEAALYAPADRPDLFAERVDELLGSEAVRESLAARGSAQRTIEVWREAAGLPRRSTEEAA
jgi:alpha-1,3-rhamnosyl/mannosyltransferase